MNYPHGTISAPDLRLRLLQMMLPVAGINAVEMAREAEAFVLGLPLEPEPPAEPTFTPPTIEEPKHDDPQAPAAPGAGHEGAEGDGTAEDADPPQPPAPGPDADAGTAEPREPAAAEGAGAEEQSALKPAEPIKVWTPERKEELRLLCAEGLEEVEIAERMGIPYRKSVIYSNAYRFKFVPAWNEARAKRRAANDPAPEPVPAEPAAEIEVVVTRKIAPEAGVELPPPPVEVKDAEVKADDRVAAALEADKPAFPVQSRTLAEVERQRMIDEHIKAKGVTTEIDYGPDQPAVDALKEAFNTVVPNKPHVGGGKPRPWLVNGSPRTTQQLWEFANRERTMRGKKPIKRAD